jgi:hypothetical protein
MAKKMTDYPTSMLKCSTRSRTLGILQEALPLMQHGSSEAFAQSLVEIFAEVGQGLCDAEPGTSETTTPTTFRQWYEKVLRPAVGGLS